MDDSQNQEDTEVIEETTLEITDNSDQSTVLTSLDEMIKNHIEGIDKLRTELKKHREMFEDSFNNNPTYHEQSEKVKEASKARGVTRANIMKQPSVMQLGNKIKDMRLEIKEREQALSEYLIEYQRLAGDVNEIEGRDGSIYEIVPNPRLIKRMTK
jgi:hypothetical protein